MVVSATALIAGCATFSPDGGFNSVADLTRERVGQAPRWERNNDNALVIQQRVDELLKVRLSAENAVEIALLNNRDLQATFQELGIAEADLVRAGRPRNPSFSFKNLSGGGITEIERAIVFDIMSMVTLPLAQETEQARFGQTQLRIASDAVATAVEARRAYYAAVASQELVSYYQQVKEAADASSDLAQRMREAGNFSKLAQMNEQAFYADATAQLARANHRAVADRERLNRVLSLSGQQTAYVLPNRLPELPMQPVQARDAEQTAIDKRLDVLRAKASTEAMAKALSLTRATGFINVLHAGYANKSNTGEPRENGYEIELEIPLFDFGTTRVARAEALYMQSVQRTADIAVKARSEVRVAYSAYRTAYDLAQQYRDEIVPLRKRISEENLLLYNGMLIGVFDLLADARRQVMAVTASVEAQRDFWLASTSLEVALTGVSPGQIGSLDRGREAAAGPIANGH